MSEHNLKPPNPDVEPASIQGYRVQYWISDTGIDVMPYSDYWNDEGVEKGKLWHVVERGFSEMHRHLQTTGLTRQLTDCMAVARQLGRPIAGTGADLACGVFWTAGVLLQAAPVQELYGVEYSRHRLLRISPSVLKEFRVPREKVILCLGSFYDLHLPDESLDFIVLAEALHHADKPGRLLNEIHRVLKPDGVVLVIGEHIMPLEPVLYARNAAKYFLSRILPSGWQMRVFGRPLTSESLFPSLQELLKPDPVTGDHYYLQAQYDSLFSSHGFAHRRITTPGCPFQGFVLTPVPGFTANGSRG